MRIYESGDEKTMQKIKNLVGVSAILVFLSVGVSGCKKSDTFAFNQDRIQEFSTSVFKPDTSVVLAYNTSPSAVANKEVLEDGLDAFLEKIKTKNVKLSAISLNKSFTTTKVRYTYDPNCQTDLLTAPPAFSAATPTYYKCELRPTGTDGAMVVDPLTNANATIAASDPAFATKKQALKTSIINRIGIDVGAASDDFCSLLSTLKEPANKLVDTRPLALAIISNKNTVASSCILYKSTPLTFNTNAALTINYQKNGSSVSKTVKVDKLFKLTWNRLKTLPDGTVTTEVYSDYPIQKKSCDFSTASPYALTTGRYCTATNIADLGYTTIVQNALASTAPVYTSAAPFRQNIITANEPCSADELNKWSVDLNYPDGLVCTRVAANGSDRTRVEVTSQVLSPSENRQSDSRNIILTSAVTSPSCSTPFEEQSTSTNWASANAYLTADSSLSGTNPACVSVTAKNPGTVTTSGATTSVKVDNSTGTGLDLYATQLNLILSTVSYKSSFVYIPTSSSTCLSNAGSAVGSGYSTIVSRLNNFFTNVAQSYDYCDGNYASALDSLASFLNSVVAYDVEKWNEREILLKVELFVPATGWQTLTDDQKGKVVPSSTSPSGYKLFLDIPESVINTNDVTRIRVTSIVPAA